MGLDQYAYVATKAGQRNEWYDGCAFNETTKDFENPKMDKPREIAYWRKHPNLQGWMESLWKRKLHEANKNEPDDEGWGSSFNGVEVELTWEDLDQLESDVKNGRLPATTGFFFGNNSDDYYKEYDLKFIRDAKAELLCGLKVFYDSSW